MSEPTAEDRPESEDRTPAPALGEESTPAPGSPAAVAAPRRASSSAAVLAPEESP